MTTLAGTEAFRTVHFENALLRLIRGTHNLPEQLVTVEKTFQRVSWTRWLLCWEFFIETSGRNSKASGFFRVWV